LSKNLVVLKDNIPPMGVIPAFGNRLYPSRWEGKSLNLMVLPVVLPNQWRG